MRIKVENEHLYQAGHSREKNPAQQWAGYEPTKGKKLQVTGTTYNVVTWKYVKNIPILILKYENLKNSTLTNGSCFFLIKSIVSGKFSYCYKTR